MNSLNRYVPNGFNKFTSSSAYKDKKRIVIDEVISTNTNKLLNNISEVFDKIGIKDGDTLSFHHHLRSGDYVLNMVCEEIKRRNIKNLTLAPSGIFPTNRILSDLIKNKNVIKIYCNYINGEVARTICNGEMEDLLIMQTHGGRPRAIESGELKIDVAFIATPTANLYGDGNGIDGKSACGALGYGISDTKYAKNKVVVTDNLVDEIKYKEIDGKYIDYVVKVDEIGDKNGIVSGTTKVTKDPIGLKIAKDATRFLDEAGYLTDGFTMQTGAGGTSLAVASFVKKVMINKNIKAKMASGGITGYFVDMLENGLVEKLMDVQCFDLDAVRSYRENDHHYAMSASQYANPYDSPIVNQLDFVILGATEIDLEFNVNVTTASNGLIIGGSGGHSDTAHGASLTIIVTPLVKSRTPIIKEKVTTITTPGEDVDVIVTERGIAINPKRLDLIEKLSNSSLNILSIEELLNKAQMLTGIPKPINLGKKVIGVVEYRDGTIIDSIYKWGK